MNILNVMQFCFSFVCIAIAVICFGEGLILFEGQEKLVVGLILFYCTARLVDWAYCAQDDLFYSIEYKKTGDDFENRYNLDNNRYEKTTKEKKGLAKS